MNAHFNGQDYKFVHSKRTENNQKIDAFVYEKNAEIIGEIRSIYESDQSAISKSLMFIWEDQTAEIHFDYPSPVNDCFSQHCKYEFSFITDFTEQPLQFNGKYQFYFILKIIPVFLQI